MHKHYFTLRALAREFAAVLTGARFVEAYSHHADELTLVFHDGAAMHDIRFVTHVQLGSCTLRPHANPPRRNVVRFFEDCAGSAIADIVMSPRDRIMRFAFESGVTLALLFHGTAGGNAILVDPAGSVTAAFKQSRAVTGSAFVEEGTSWEDACRGERIAQALRESTGGLVDALTRAVPVLGKLLAAEACARAGIDPSCDVRTAPIERVVSSVEAIVHSGVSDAAPRVVVTSTDVRFALIPLTHLSIVESIAARDVNDGVRRWIAERGKRGQAQAAVRDLTAQMRDGLQRTRASLAHAERDAADDRASLYRAMGEAILGAVGEIPAGATTIALAGMTIALDPKQSAGQNATAYFAKAKRRAAARAASAERALRLRTRLAAAEQAQRELAAVHTADDARAFAARHADLLARMKTAADSAERVPYRRFDLAEGVTVYVGKNARDNDELTFAFARQNDLWFHARGVEGSHAILRWDRRGEPEKEFIRQAAAIAAYYSKARTSKLAPVAYTVRKYVHKPRGAKPGTVVMDREQVVMVAPWVPVENEE